MKLAHFALPVLFLGFASTANAGEAGCNYGAEQQAAVHELSVDKVEKLIQTKQAAIFDANGQETRETHGIVPGAVLLSHYRTYDLAELPKDKSKQVVFYCSSKKCSAAPTAAEKASEAGYTHVAVMPLGIKGWKEAGKKTAKPKNNS